MQVTHLDAVVGQKLGELLGHPLGQHRDQHAVADLDALVDLGEHIVDLGASRTHLDFRIDEAGWTHELLGHLPCRLFLVIRRRGRHEHDLAHLALELVELERAIIER